MGVDGVKRASLWKLRTRTLHFAREPLLMGIVNVTPDSFSDGGRFFAIDAAVEHGLKLAAEGAAILDIGGESTRPYAAPVPPEEELRRVLPVMERLAAAIDLPLSIDTMKARIAAAALSAGAEIINDVSGLEADPVMIGLARATQAGVCAMHMRGTPQTMQDDPRYADVVAEVQAYLRERRDQLLAAGIERERICLDPGIGFGKTHQHNLTLTAHCEPLHELGCPLLVGLSRKGFIAKVCGDQASDRTFGTVGACLAVARQGVQVLRVHDIGAVAPAMRLFAACGGIDGRESSLE